MGVLSFTRRPARRALLEEAMHLDAPLPTARLEPGIPIAQASPWHEAPVSLDSPALDVMTDLTKVKAATTHPSEENCDGRRDNPLAESRCTWT